MVKDVFLDKVHVPEKNIHRLQGEIDPRLAAGRYEAILRDFFPGTRNRDLPEWTFDLTLLGMGGDGHTASLFPRTGALGESQRMIVANYVPKLESWRITLTPTAINLSRTVIFLVVGEGKADRVAGVLEGPSRPDLLPSQLIRPENGELCWYLDHDAASGLRKIGSRRRLEDLPNET
jgi:6-phosphogluconolactonase